MENLKIREFQMSLENFVNSSDVALEVKRMVIANMLFKIEQETNEQLLKEIAERDKEANKNAQSV